VARESAAGYVSCAAIGGDLPPADARLAGQGLAGQRLADEGLQASVEGEAAAGPSTVGGTEPSTAARSMPEGLATGVGVGAACGSANARRDTMVRDGRDLRVPVEGA